jgi:hypothetical protein
MKQSTLIIRNPKLRQLLEPYELRVGELLVSLGHSVEFITPDNAPGRKTPDIIMDGNYRRLRARKETAHKLLNDSSGARQAERVTWFLIFQG